MFKVRCSIFNVQCSMFGPANPCNLALCQLHLHTMKWNAWLILFPLISTASEIPQSILPQGVGVNIHFVTGHERDLDLIAAGGFKFIRMDFGWSGIEKKKGEYDWTGYEELIGNLHKRG